MSKLPAALAARLAKRGLINHNSTTTTNVPNKFEEEEEVIAEDYDDLNNKSSLSSSLDNTTFFNTTTGTTSKIDSKIYDTVGGCPNKYNVYHNCSLYCVKRYREIGDEEPSKIIRKKFVRLLKKYPLKKEDTLIWEQVYEPGLKTYYFWNTETDQVSWLPPSHPDCKPSIPAEKLRKLLREDDDEEEEEFDDNDDVNNGNRKKGGSEDDLDDSDDDSDDDDNSDDNSEDDGSDDDSNDSKSDDDVDKLQLPSSKFQIRKNLPPPPVQPVAPSSSNNRKVFKRNDLDPMDPASYSDIPRGKWSDGLRESREKGE